MSIFRAYDIRGVYPNELDEELARKIGAAFGTFLKRNGVQNPKIAVGRDMRLSGPKIKGAFIYGLVSTGAIVYDIGMVPTPLVYFAIVKHNLDGGCSVTASHNPKEYNGFKPCLRDAEPLGGDGIKELERLAGAGDFETGKGRVEKLDVTEDYIREHSEKFRLARKLKIVIDAGNGMAGVVAPRIFKNIGCEVVEMYCEPDGSFPNHEADPLKRETLKNLQHKVTETGADFGVAYDGDGDRSGFVNNKGDIIKNDEAFALFIKDMAKGTDDLKVVYDVSSSKVIEDVTRSCGGVPIIWNVGYTFLRAKMKEEKSVIAGEGSGHYFFSKNGGYDDAIYASLVFAKIASRGNLEQMLSQLPKYVTSDDTRFDCPDNVKFRVVDEIKESLKAQGHELIDIDGVRVKMGSGWFLIRASNTSPKIVLRWEAGSEEEFRKVGEFAKKLINEALKHPE